MVRHTLQALGPKVLATRMVRDYTEQLYAPAAQSLRRTIVQPIDGVPFGAARGTGRLPPQGARGVAEDTDHRRGQHRPARHPAAGLAS